MIQRPVIVISQPTQWPSQGAPPGASVTIPISAKQQSGEDIFNCDHFVIGKHQTTLQVSRQQVDLTKDYAALFARSAMRPGELNPPHIGWFGRNYDGVMTIEMVPGYERFASQAEAYVRKYILARLPADPWPSMNRLYNLGPYWSRYLPSKLNWFIRSFDTSRSRDMYWHHGFSLKPQEVGDIRMAAASK